MRLKFYKIKSAFFLLLLLISVSCADRAPADSQEEDDEPIEITEVPTLYGIPFESYKIHDGIIKKNQFLSDILLGYGVPYGSIAVLADVAKDVHDVRNLRAGDKYAMFCTKDSSETACFFVVETSPSQYVVYQLNDSISAYIGNKPVEYRIRKASGVINSSLSQTIADQLQSNG